MKDNIIFSLISNFFQKVLRYKSETSLPSALKRCVTRDSTISTVIDIGASDGCWSRTARNYFPKAYYHLIEANPVHAQALEKLRSHWKNYDYSLAAAGDTLGEIYLNSDDPYGGIASHVQYNSADLRVPVITVDRIVEQHNLQPPYLLKLDTHGFEVRILDGASQTLANTNLIILETYNFDINPESLRFPQMCQYLEDKGFRCIDICDPLFRGQDKALWQLDLFFVPKSKHFFQDNEWR